MHVCTHAFRFDGRDRQDSKEGDGVSGSSSKQGSMGTYARAHACIGHQGAMREITGAKAFVHKEEEASSAAGQGIPPGHSGGFDFEGPNTFGF